MPRYDNEHERRIAVSVQHEEAEISGSSKMDDPEEIDCVCLECGERFSEEDPDTCPLCGGVDLDVA